MFVFVYIYARLCVRHEAAFFNIRVLLAIAVFGTFKMLNPFVQYRFERRSVHLES